MPALRQDLGLLEGGTLPDGQPFWTLHDPSRHLFFRIDWPAFEILRRWTLGDPGRIAADISRETTLQMESGQVLALAQTLSENQLLEKSGAALSAQYEILEGARSGGVFAKLLRTYLFVRIPLFRPDTWLENCLAFVAIFWTRTFQILTGLVLLAGVSLVMRQWEGFRHAVIDTFTPQGLFSWGAALVVVKCLHELGHAFAAKRQGCRVPTMGIVLLVMWPVAYTDTSEVWRLSDRAGRLKVAVAGIVTELIVAAWATLAWGLLPDGGARNAALVLAGSSWISTLAINASPFLRFDGYFILSDLLDFPNLHQRSAALALWHLRQALFGEAGPKPEHLRLARERMVVLFAIAAWLFRLIVFFGIALLVYHFFFKALGVVLFLVEVWWFILAPAAREMKTWNKGFPLWWRDGRGHRRAAMWLAGLGLAVAVCAFPWSGKISTSGMLQPRGMVRLFAPGAARIIALQTREERLFGSGELLLELEAPVAVTRVSKADAVARSLAREAASAPLEERTRGETPALIQERDRALAELGDAQREVSRYQVQAPSGGRIFQADPDLAVGQWVKDKELLAVFVPENGWEVEGFIDEYTVPRLSVGASARFMLEGDPEIVLPLSLVAVDRDATAQLPDGMLAAQSGGDVLCRLDGDRYVPESAVYRAVFKVITPEPGLMGHSWRGRIVVDAAGESLIGRYFRRLAAILWRESGV